MRLKCGMLHLLSFLLALTIFIPAATAINTYYTTNYFPSSTGCFLNFEETQTFDNVYTVSASNTTWANWIFFNDTTGFYLADCNATVNTYFKDKRLQLETSGSSTTATLKVYYPTEHMPETISGATTWSFAQDTFVTSVTFSANTSLGFDWNTGTTGGGGNGSPTPTPEPTATVEPTAPPELTDPILIGLILAVGAFVCLLLIVDGKRKHKKYTTTQWRDPYYA